MKNLLIVAGASVLIFSVAVCEPTPEISVAEVLKNPSSYHRQSAIFKDGTVVFKKQKEETNVIVVVSHPFPKIKSVADLHENEVFPIKIIAADYEKVDIGSIVTVKGYVARTGKKGKTVYYINARGTMVTGHEDIDNPDFEKLAEVLNQEAEDDAFAARFFSFIFPTFIPRF